MNECTGMSFNMTFDQVVRVSSNPEEIKELQKEIDELNQKVEVNSEKLSGIEDGAEVNDISVIKINGTVVEPVDKVIDINSKDINDIPDIADAVDNGIGYDNNNDIVVKSLDITKLVQDEDVNVVLNGGKAI